MHGSIAAWRLGSIPGLLWVDFERYAYRVFAGSPSDWYRDPVRYAAACLQARDVVGSDVVTVDMIAPYCDAWAHDAGLDAELSGLSPVASVQALLEADNPTRFLDAAIDALAHRLAGKADLVLKLPAPSELLTAFGASTDTEPAFDALDDVATTLANFVRRFSAKPLSALQIATNHPQGMSADELEAIDPLLRTAAYYGWVSVLSFDSYCNGVLPQAAADLLLVPEVRTLDAGNVVVGGGLDRSFWDGEDPPAGIALRYGTIPDDVTPEAVIERMAHATG